MASEQKRPSADKPRAAFRSCYIPEQAELTSEQLAQLTSRTDSSHVERPYVPKDELVAYPSEANPAREPTFMSLGDNGTTASFTDMGQLMQVCSYLDAGHSSMFSAHPPQIDEPVLHAFREDSLQSLCQYSDGFGMDVSSPLSAQGWSGEADFKIERSFIRNRWPVLSVTCKRWELEMRCIIHKGVVIQQELLRNKTDGPLLFVGTFRSRSLIRDLDHVDSNYHFNEDEDEDDDTSSDDEDGGVTGVQTNEPNKLNQYAESVGLGGYGFVRVHRLPAYDVTRDARPDRTWYDDKSGRGAPDASAADPDCNAEAVGLVMGVFVDGKALPWAEFEDEEAVPGQKRHEITVEAGQMVDLTAGYKMVLLDSQNLDWKRVTITADDVDCDAILGRTKSPFLVEHKLDYATGRNVEHILSVCAIPVKLNDRSFSDMVGELWRLQPLALTCGDISGHRVSSSASYFAFKLLISVSQALESSSPLKGRIFETCRAHLLWVFKQVQIDDSHFGSEYWVNGRKIYPPESSEREPPVSTSFQILKAVEFWKICDREDRHTVTDLLEGGTGQTFMKWLERLDRRSVRDRYAWRHSSKTDISTFRLDDHALIWSSLRSLNVLFDGRSTEARNRKHGTDAQPKRGPTMKEKAESKLKKKYELEKVRREMITRFTTVNDHFKQRMLAFTRSAREDRFVLHSRDTALFYDDFLPLDSQVWKNTLNAQKDQKENQDIETDNPLRYALVVLLDNLNYSINRSETSASAALAILEGSQLANGLFPGRLDESTKTEKSFDYAYSRDFYYHVTFEIPYFLWTCKKRSSPVAPADFPAVTRRSRVVIPDSPQDPFQAKHQRQSSVVAGIDQNSPDLTETALAIEAISQGISSSKVVALTTGKMVSNTFINSQNVVEVAEEWLYDRPAFFDYSPEAANLPWRKVLKDAQSSRFGPCLESALEQVFKRLDLEEVRAMTASDPVEEFPRSLPVPHDLSRRPYAPDVLLNTGTWANNIIIDFSKKSIHGKSANAKNSQNLRLSNQQFWHRLSSKRQIDSSKKRLIWMRDATPDVAVMCLFSTHEEEKENISLFFDLHSSFETCFLDVAVRIRNTWETHIQISFLQLATKVETDGLGPAHRIIKVEPESLPDLEGRSLFRASAGFRFHGDFMDRFWTCHVLLFIPHKTDSQPSDEIVHPRNGKFNRGQRKVLELCLFCYMIGEVNKSLDEILNDVIKDKIEQFNRSNDLDRDLLSQATLDLGAHTQVLEVLEQDLGRILDTVTDWENRERDRQQERPRWTKADETKHGFEVNKFSILSRRRVRELRGYMATIRTQKNAVNLIQDRIRYEQDRIRSEQERRGNENIRYFTYATVFFLPLSFAVSIYSMQAPPSRDLLIDMAKVAVIGIVITVTALAGIQWAVTHRFRKNDNFAAKYKMKITPKSPEVSSSKPDASPGKKEETVHSIRGLAKGNVSLRKRLLGKGTKLEEKDLESGA